VVVPAVDADTNLEVAGLLADLALAQSAPQKRWGYRQAAAAIRRLDRPVESLLRADRTLDRIPRIGPASTRVILEVLETGGSPSVERAVAESDQRDQILRQRLWRSRFLSAARVNAILEDPSLDAVRPSDYRGDLQMHSTWSDGAQSLGEIVDTGMRLGYTHAALTDHAGGLRIARGLPHARFQEQFLAIDAVNVACAGRFRLLKGVEANIGADGSVDVEPEHRDQFDIVIAAPHAVLRSTALQTDRLVTAVTSPGIHILGHPRGRMYGTRPGIAADWAAVFEAAAGANVAVEIDGDPSRQDLDYELAALALDRGCLFALDSDAHATDQWRYAEIALAHARLAGIPSERVINCWSLDRLLDWARRAQ
jgi:histidinol phosphatase-like PHP family hydrolase